MNCSTKQWSVDYCNKSILIKLLIMLSYRKCFEWNIYQLSQLVEEYFLKKGMETENWTERSYSPNDFYLRKNFVWIILATVYPLLLYLSLPLRTFRNVLINLKSTSWLYQKYRNENKKNKLFHLIDWKM